MKSRIALLTFFFFSVSNSFAQPLKVGVEGGFSAAFAIQSEAILWATSANRITKDVRFGARFGVPLQCQLGNSTALHSGLFYASKGINKYVDYISFVSNIAYNTVELPLAFVYTRNVHKKSRFFIGAGAYLGYAINGKLRYFGTGNLPVKKPVKFGNDMNVNNMRRLEYGLHFQTGLAFQNGLLIRLTAQKQLNDLAIKDNSLGFNQIKNQGYIAISMAYLFNY